MEITINPNDEITVAIKERLRRAEALLRRYREECYDVKLDALVDVHFARVPKEAK